MNITLSTDKKIIDNARLYAEKHNTTLNNLVREYLVQITNRMSTHDTAREFENMARNSGGESAENFKFNRDEIYGRNIQ